MAAANSAARSAGAMSTGNGNDGDAASAGLVSTPTWVTLSKFSLTYEEVGTSGRHHAIRSPANNRARTKTIWSFVSSGLSDWAIANAPSPTIAQHSRAARSTGWWGISPAS